MVQTRLQPSQLVTDCSSLSHEELLTISDPVRDKLAPELLAKLLQCQGHADGAVALGTQPMGGWVGGLRWPFSMGSSHR